jgi:hypothetical protein
MPIATHGVVSYLCVCLQTLAMQRNGLIRVLIFFLLFAGSLRAQPGDNTFLRLTKDSLEYALIDNWHYSAGDNMHWASLAYPDSNWQIESTWQGGRHPKQILPRISWWRKRISIDSSLAGKSLALVMQQSGASELYVIGALLTKFGTIDSGGQVLEHYTSGGQPYVFVLADTGTYLLAVRHARSKADTWAQGFAMSVDHANRAIEQDRANAIGNTGISLFLFGLFLAFSILHGTMYLYYRAGRSNLWFAIFSFCLAFIFLGICANVMHSMRLVQVFGQSLFYIVLLACFALSGFINSVFFKRRIWLRVLILAAVPFTFLGEQVIGKIVVAAIISASIETVLTIGFAMYRRLPGARIIASGLLLFAALLLYLFLKIVLQGDAGLNLSGREANIAMLVFGAAILCMLLSMSAYLSKDPAYRSGTPVCGSPPQRSGKAAVAGKPTGRAGARGSNAYGRAAQAKAEE